MSWKLIVPNRAKKDLKRLDHQDQSKVLAALDKLARSGEGDVTRLTDVRPPEWRLRVGENRVRFAYVPEDGAIVVLRILPRGKAYER